MDYQTINPVLEEVEDEKESKWFGFTDDNGSKPLTIENLKHTLEDLEDLHNATKEAWRICKYEYERRLKEEEF